MGHSLGASMFSYNRDEMAASAIQRALAQASENVESDDKSLAFVCRQLGRAIIGWLAVIIVIEQAVKYWGGPL
jgi:hypothetical protein